MNRSNRKLTTIYLVMFALIFNAVTSSVAYGMAERNGMLLCTSQGYKLVQVENETSPTERVQQHCELCLFPPSDECFEPFIADIDSPFLLAARQTSSANSVLQIAKTRYSYLFAQGRAPPLSISFI